MNKEERDIDKVNGGEADREGALGYKVNGGEADSDDTLEYTEYMPEEEAEAAPEAAVKKWRDKFKACDEEKRALHEELQRVRADFLNARRMNEESLQRDRERITARHIEALLPLADSFDMAMQGDAWEACDETWRKGVEAIRAQLDRIFADHGVDAISESDVPFDPQIHEAVSQQPVEGAEPDTVVHVLQKGYKHNDEIIRPAKVVVSS